MICAGTAVNPMQCGADAVTIISGFAMCQKHANEIAMQFRILKKQLKQQQQQQQLKNPYESKSIYSNDIPSRSLKGLDGLKDGVFKNVKHKY